MMAALWFIVALAANSTFSIPIYSFPEIGGTFIAFQAKDTIHHKVDGEYDNKVHYRGEIQTLSFFPHQTLSLLNGTIWFGPTKLVAKQIQLFGDAQVTPQGVQMQAGDGIAKGGVQVYDPLGSFECTSLKFNSDSHTGLANEITIHLQNSVINAKSLSIEPGTWILNNVVISDRSSHNLFRFKLTKMTIHPGYELIGRHAKIQILGRTIGILPHLSQNLDKRVFGFRPPFPSYSPQNGASFNFGSSFLAAPQTTLGIGASLSTRFSPSYSFQLSKSFLPRRLTNGLITPVSDFDQRFQYGYFDNIEVLNPWDDGEYISAKRDTISLGTFVNSNTFDRKQSQTFDEPLVLTYEHSQSFGPIGFLANFHLESINQVGLNTQIRGVFTTAIAPLNWAIGPHTLLQTRLDGASYLGTRQFGWLRAELGVVTRLNSHVRLGGGFVGAHEFGTSQFVSDELYSRNGWFARMDYNSGPTQLSLLEKYDSDRNVFYDQELSFSQASGLFSPFIVVRLFPQALIFGVRFRFNAILNQLQSRNPKRPVDLHKNMELTP